MLRLETDSLTAPELHFRLTTKMPNETLDILCSESVTKTLGNVTAEKLKNARTPEGYLLPERVRSSVGELRKLANCITRLAKTEGLGRADAAESAAFVDNPYDEYLFEGIRAELIEVTEVSANDNGPCMIKYVIEGIEKFYRFVIRCVDDIVNAIYAVFRKFGVKTRDLFRWLAYLFEWDDIVRTQDAVERLFREGTLTAVRKAVSLKSELADKNEAVKSSAKEIILNAAARFGGKSAPACALEKEREAPDFKIFTLGDPVSELCLNDLTNGKRTGAAAGRVRRREFAC